MVRPNSAIHKTGVAVGALPTRGRKTLRIRMTHRVGRECGFRHGMLLTADIRDNQVVLTPSKHGKKLIDMDRFDRGGGGTYYLVLHGRQEIADIKVAAIGCEFTARHRHLTIELPDCFHSAVSPRGMTAANPPSLPPPVALPAASERPAPTPEAALRLPAADTSPEASQ